METPAAGAARLWSLLFTVGAGERDRDTILDVWQQHRRCLRLCVSVCVSRSGAEEEEEGVGRRRWGERQRVRRPLAQRSREEVFPRGKTRC